MPDTIWYHPSNILISPVVASDNTIYIGADRDLIALNQNGSLKWSFDMAPAIGSDGTVYIGCGTGLFAFTSSAPGLAQSSWPRARHDNRNSGNVLTQ